MILNLPNGNANRFYIKVYHTTIVLQFSLVIDTLPNIL
jgi:hypothetical protein